MVEEWVQEKPDFAAEVRLRTSEEGGRKSSPLQGYLCDFQYDDDKPADAWMIYPCFLDKSGVPLAHDTPIPPRSKAHFRILNEQLRVTVHKQRLSPGTRFFLVEGSRKVADGTVTELLAISEK